MEENADFSYMLETALQKYRSSLERKDLQKLKEQFRFYHNSFKSLYDVLIQKGLLNTDPYKHEHKISDVTIPPTGPMNESEKKDTLSQRLSLFESILEFLNNYYQFQIDNLTLPNVKQLAELVNYIRWNKFSQSSANLNTRVFAEIVRRLSPAQDNLSASIANDSIRQLAKQSSIILGILKKVSVYQRERYKYDFRLQLLNALRLTPETIESKREDVVKSIKSQFPKQMPGTPYYTELIEEVLAEEAGSAAELQRQETLKRLKIEQEQSDKKAPASFKPVLMEGIRLLSTAATPLEQAIQKLKINSQLIENRTLTFGEKFRRWLFNIVQKDEDQRIYEIEYIDPQTVTSKTIRLNFDKFIDDMQKKTRIVAALGNRMGTTYQKLEQSDEERIYKVLSSTIADLQLYLIRLPALDTYFKSETTRNQRALIKGIKIEISAIKNTVIKANQKKHEYVARKEEAEQLKKLGINVT
jgi:hypothetical protein